MTLTALDSALWAAGFLGHVALLSVLVNRGRWKQFPVFSAMIAFQILNTATLFLISPKERPDTYYLAYWISTFADFALQIGLTFEIARAVLRPTKLWVQDARAGFLGWSAVGVALATAVAFCIDSSAAKGLALWEVRTILFTSVLTLELFLSMSAAANRLGLPWRSHVMAVGQGIAAIAVISVLSDIGHMHYGWSHEFVIFDHVSNFVYLGCLLYWGVSLWQPERERAPLSKEMQEYLLALHRRVQYDLERPNTENAPL